MVCGESDETIERVMFFCQHTKQSIAKIANPTEPSDPNPPNPTWMANLPNSNWWWFDNYSTRYIVVGLQVFGFKTQTRPTLPLYFIYIFLIYLFILS